jgi:hypothetical protein
MSTSSWASNLAASRPRCKHPREEMKRGPDPRLVGIGVHEDLRARRAERKVEAVTSVLSSLE